MRMLYLEALYDGAKLTTTWAPSSSALMYGWLPPMRGRLLTDLQGGSTSDLLRHLLLDLETAHMSMLRDLESHCRDLEKPAFLFTDAPSPLSAPLPRER